MSTRANVIITDGTDELIFYRHSDGYPKGTMPTLKKFLKYVQTGRIRDNVGQAAGWLIVLGHEEYLKDAEEAVKRNPRFKKDYVTKPFTPGAVDGCSSWKVGAYEPTGCIHGDIEYLYVVDLKRKEIRYTQDFSPASVAVLKSGSASVQK